MICKQPLSAEQKRRGRFNYNMFSFVNGISYMCLGETVLILLAVQQNVPDWVVSALGAMIYTGYLMLILGKIITARVGAAKTQSVCWAIRNAAALLVASSVLFYHAGMSKTAIAAILTGAFLFYGFRAAGVIMAQPLIGDMSDEENRGKFLAFNNALFFFSSVLTLIAVTVTLKFSSSIWMLAGIIVFGAVCGLGASRFLSRIDETAALQESARKPLKDDLIYTCKSESLRKQIVAGFAVNLAIILTVPISMLALKRGYSMDDMSAMIFALIQFASSTIMSLLTARIAEKYGPRKLLIWSCAALLMIPVLWFIAPGNFNWFYCALPFIIAGAANVASLNAMIHYFLQNVDRQRRVAVSMFVSITTGAGAGLAGTLLASILLKIAELNANAAVPLSRYRMFFLCAFVLLIPCLYLVSRLKPLPPDKRKLPR